MSEQAEKRILLGNCVLNNEDKSTSGGFVEIDGETFYKISGYNKMDPFFITIVSNSDHWMFLSSNGGITAGRKNPDIALFPYYTVDKIQDSENITGSKSIFLVTREMNTSLWEPFSDRTGIYRIQRNLYKSIYGNKIIFEEINQDLKLTFSYSWMNSEKFGIIRKSVLTNQVGSDCRISMLDGIQNILPAGVNRTLQLSLSNLIDAYKKNELLENSGIALYMLSSILVDRAEPSEALTSNVVWSEGLPDAKILLSSRQIDDFRNGYQVKPEIDIRAERGAYLLNADIDLGEKKETTWQIIADVNKDAGMIASLKHLLKGNDIAGILKKDISEGTEEVIKIIAAVDGLQLTEDKLSISRHLSNVFFNIMRGGIFDNYYWISKADLLDFIKASNVNVYQNNSSFLESIDADITIKNLLQKAAGKDPQLLRLCYEYLPLILSRRHGDPSRPWNIFSIELKKENGTKSLNYQGNWRDIFQNWEALALSYPSFIESMVCKFLNASTADGYNPYRITRDGIDWETPDPHDPWASIGYWGDHQVIYLLKLLETSKKYHPEKLKGMLSEDIFAYADVPYRIKPYKDLVKNPFITIDFDSQAHKAALQRVASSGSDGRLIKDNNNDEVKLVNFTEKILVSVLTKLSNFIPGAGIWMNTQRPEWNDANNALVGFGSSVVTLCYLRRLLHFLKELFSENIYEEFELSAEVISFFKSVNDTFIKYESLLEQEFSDKNRRSVIDALGTSGSDYREIIYGKGFSGKKYRISARELMEFFTLSMKFTDQSIRQNKRNDNLYHSYNLISFKIDGVTIRRLYEMLEGQVAVLSSGLLKPGEVNEVLDALKSSAIFRKDQYSYMLYPDRQLPRFIEKNIIPPNLVTGSRVLTELIGALNADILYKDMDGLYHFNSGFRNVSYLKIALENLGAEYKIMEDEKNYIVDLYEKVFDHQSFTGRSGTFYGYEGLGCIYWHMVSKLMLAISENYFIALKTDAGSAQLNKMVEHYYDVRAGLGLNKEPEAYGAFPTDAYSHTPGNGGAKQPGMTGQVKEDIISRFGELGVIIESGKISFKPGLLRRSEFLQHPSGFHYLAAGKPEKIIPLETDSLAFTICQVPVIYHISARNFITIISDKGNFEIDGLTLDADTSVSIFERNGSVMQLDVYLSPGVK